VAPPSKTSALLPKYPPAGQEQGALSGHEAGSGAQVHGHVSPQVSQYHGVKQYSSGAHEVEPQGTGLPVAVVVDPPDAVEPPVARSVPAPQPATRAMKQGSRM
jgi:hypothetical protein